MSILDLAWLAGLLEGEGCFPRGGTSIGVKLAMTDQDVVKKAASLMGGSVYGPYDRGPGRKPLYVTHVNGARAAAIMMSIWGFMCSRRRERILWCLRIWRGQEIHNKYKETCKRGHPLTGINLRTASYGRVCRTCQAMHQRAFKTRRRLALAS